MPATPKKNRAHLPFGGDFRDNSRARARKRDDNNDNNSR
ncbi:hypothetical protein BN2497_13887 [Janthinobacterium sp. CG23_2]|nr:hypothetical protein BN2497_13887 [Janthinobacterium sp. CG23_2]CUU33341.1 hypothetical protein BN3177_13887 [Janthinobacterium sp. CG23_2]